MSELETNSNTPPSIPPKRWGRRLFLWGVLAGGGFLLILLMVLIKITLPNLREIPAPEISGPSQLSQSQSSPEHSTSKTLTLDASGKPGVLNLDDFPHLSPPMRRLAQAWIVQCEESNNALDTITDPTVRAPAIAILMSGRENIRVILNRPREWGNLQYEKAYENALQYFGKPIPIYDPTGEIGNDSVWPKLALYTQFSDARAKEVRSAECIARRLAFEFFVYSRQWNVAAETACTNNEFSSSLEKSGYEPQEANTWDEEVYSWRQLGGRGLACLTARSYQRALGSTQLEKRHPRLHFSLDGLGLLVICKMRVELDKTEPGDTRKTPYPPSPLDPQSRKQVEETFAGTDLSTPEETKAIMQSLEEETDKADTSATLPSNG